MFELEARKQEALAVRLENLPRLRGGEVKNASFVEGQATLPNPHISILVLNSTFEPLHITNGKRAIVLLLKRKA